MQEPPVLPTGTVTFLFSDIAGSTSLWEKYPEAMAQAMDLHDETFARIVAVNEGTLVKPRGEGDSRFIVFSRAQDGVNAAVEIQRTLAGSFSDYPFRIDVRIGLHTGTADLRLGDYYGSTVNRCARIRSLGHGGQTLVSRVTAELTRDHLSDGVSLKDMGDHRLAGLSREEKIFQLVVPGLQNEFPPLKSVSATRTNLPVPPTLLIGRQDELENIRMDLLKPDSRLVTLTGPGGTGKTRLALEVASSLLADFPDGVFFVDLSPIYEVELLATSITQSMGFREGGGQSPLEILKGLLSEKAFLIVLDNFEQIIPAAEVIGELLATSPRVKFLVTSRIPLQVRGEREVPVKPLTVPSKVERPTLEQVKGAEAVQLFVRQAQAVKPSFELTRDNVETVARICRRLDGLPLAIEIAAARTRMFPPQVILSRLDQSMKLLVGGAVDLPVRQQTMRGAVEWSYDLLEEEQKILFDRLSVFQGGFMLENVEAVCDPEGNLDIFSGIEALLLNNLIRLVDTTYDEARFDMLQTIRAFALENLDAANGVSESLQARHAGYFAQKALQMSDRVFSQDGVLWIDRINEDIDNFRAAISWSLRNQIPPEAAAQICAWLFWFWYRNGHFHEGRDWSQRTLDALPRDADPVSRAMVLNSLALMGMWEGDLTFAVQLLEEALQLVEQVNFEMGITVIKMGYGVTLINQGRDREAYAQLVDAAEMADETKEPFYAWEKGTIMVHLANAMLGLGEYDRAISWLDQAFPMIEKIGDRWQIAFCLNNYGEVYRAQGEYEKAEEYYLRTKEYYRQADAMGDQARLVFTSGYIAFHKGDYSRAEEYFRESLDEFLELGNKRGIAECLLGLSHLGLEVGGADWAVPLFSAAQSQMQSSGAAWWPADRVEVEKMLGNMESKLDPEQLNRLKEQGSRMSLVQAVEYSKGFQREIFNNSD